MVRKCTGFVLRHELLGEKERQVANCGTEVEERSSLVWKRSEVSSKKTNKGSKNAWE